MDATKVHHAGLSGRKTENLSPHDTERHYSDNGSTSFSHLPYSHAIEKTEEDGNSKIGLDTAQSRKYTIDTSVKISRLDCIKGLFMIKSLRRKVATTVEIQGMEVPNDKSKHTSPYILTVHVLSNEMRDDTHFLDREAQCSLDTGNHQGNMVSKEFLFNVLRYTKEALGPLTEQEQNGGTSASGHRLTPDGAVHLTWYYAKTSRIFRDMRFLVVSSTSFDLIVGERTIRKHHLLSPPNFTVGLQGKKYLKTESEPEYTKLTTRAKDLENRLDNFNEDLEKAAKASKQQTITTLNAKINALEKELNIANAEVEYYLAKKEMDNDPTPDNQKEFTIVQSKLDEAKLALPNVPQTIPNISITQASGSDCARRSLGNFFRGRG